MKERNLGRITQLTVLYALRKTHNKEKFIAELKARGIDVVFDFVVIGLPLPKPAEEECRLHSLEKQASLFSLVCTTFRYTSDGRIYGTTFIDNRTGCVLNGSRMGKEVSANTLQEHFTLPYENQPPIPITIHETNAENTADTAGVTANSQEQSEHIDGLGLLNTDAPAVNREEEAFIRAMQRRKKKKRKGFKL